MVSVISYFVSMPLPQYLTFKLSLGFFTANTSPEIHNVVERVREDIDPGIYVLLVAGWFETLEKINIYFTAFISIMWYCSSVYVFCINYTYFLPLVVEGGHAFNIRASDAENDTLVYGLTGQNAAFFTVNQWTGEVTVRMQLDREVW